MKTKTPSYSVAGPDGTGAGSPQKFERRPLSTIPYEVLTKVLANPKNKMLAKIRKRMMMARNEEVIVPRKPGIVNPVRRALKLQRLTMEQLKRRLKQTATRASTAKFLLAKLAKGSRFAPGLQAVQDENLNFFKQIRAEISARVSPCKP